MAVNLGVAAHISGAAQGGPRYDPNLTAQVRSSSRNGIWLCQNCAKKIDNDPLGHPEDLLVQWKSEAERDAHRRVGRPHGVRSGVLAAERSLKRDQRMRDQIKKDLTRPWEEMLQTRRSDRPQRPFEKFRYSKIVVHRLGDDTYPESDDRPGISGWFRVEPFDFYHGGIKVVLDIESGVIEMSNSFAGNLQWALIPFGADFDRENFRPIRVWRLVL